MTPQDHYTHVLARHYSWMFDMSFAAMAGAQAKILRRAGIGSPGVAIDLGCGPGFQTYALSALGAREVHAIDTSAELLGELKTQCADCPVEAHQGDLMEFAWIVDMPADTIVCMGDTLTHLPDTISVLALFRTMAGALRPGGRAVLSWRDLTVPPAGTGRFIPVRADADRIMTCFVEDLGETVAIHDLVHVRDGESWRLETGAYPKLKLSACWIDAALRSAGLEPDFHEIERGMCVASAVKRG